MNTSVPSFRNAETPSALQLRIDRTLDQPMYLQICQRFKTAIELGHLRAGDRVPAARALAAELSLARSTVDLAYRILADEGYFQGRGAAGTVVSPRLPQAVVARPQGSLPPVAPATIVDHDGKAPKPLQLGLPALDAFPRKVWNRLVTHRLRGSEPMRLGYPDPQGFEELRERIATYLGVSRGVSCVPEQVFVTTGLRTTLELSLRSLSSPGDAFWFEDPGYILARPFLHNAAVTVVPVPVDEHGLRVDEGRRLSPYARFAMVTPSNQSPLGVTLSLERRMALLDWASEAGSWIIEDDYDSEFRYQGRPLPALKSLDRNDRVIYAGTFSKVMFPGLRLAYAVAPLSAVRRFQAVSSNLNAGSPYLLQSSVADFMAQGHFPRHLKKMRQLYAERRAVAQRAFQRVLGERVRIDLRPGGLHLLARLADGDSDMALAERARDAGLAVHPLSRWYMAAPPRQGLLMGFANIADEREALRLAGRLQAALG
ncbi:DNA-binding protein [Comamonas serinivorans]|uniref:DNA-binding protein n=1 Tax=Comamonas serinivorans TaxID=1082851 RepID=A0A1Y0EID4_9BURK|nr:PLP-dependent aminotransferase family protein [Comamonas serinivorans]ARU03363.1 DNA-binding protein [Comamonas serinivorans]